MKRSIAVLALLLVSAPVFAIYEVGDTPKNYCWKDVNNADVCLEDGSRSSLVRVLLYNTGWCGPCNSEFRELPSATEEFAGKAVEFISLSAAGWTTGSAPDQKFLEEWRAKHKLDQAKATFIVAASPRNAGKDFFTDVYIPNVAIIGVDGKVAYKAINPGADKIADEVRKALP